MRKPSKDSHIQLVVPRALRKRLFDVTHSGSLAAHVGPERTLLQLKHLCMTTDIPLWYQQCETCAQSHGPPTKHQDQLQKVLTGAPLDIIAVDILFGLPTTPAGMKYILVITDYFTKWASAFAPFWMLKRRLAFVRWSFLHFRSPMPASLRSRQKFSN